METKATAPESGHSPRPQDRKHRFQWRAFVSVTTMLSFLGMSVTGVALFVTPPGRIAYWTGWTLSGLTKDQWVALHIWCSLVFLVGAAFHLYLNRKALVSYFRDRARQTFALRWEWVVSLAIGALVLVGTLAEIAPFSNVLALNERIKQRWDRPTQRAPVPHAESMTLNEVAETVKGLDIETMIHNLQESGIEVKSSDAVVGELAQQNDMTPHRLYATATGGGQGVRGRGGNRRFFDGPSRRGGFGIGRLTLRQYCDQEQLDVGAAIAKLQRSDLEATPNTPIREIAADSGLHPSAIRDLLGRRARPSRVNP
jgi:Domain of unknown function (DUF4405)